MLIEFKTEYSEIFKNPEEFNNEFIEMQQRNIDMLNIYNKNCILISALKIRKNNMKK